MFDEIKESYNNSTVEQWQQLVSESWLSSFLQCDKEENICTHALENKSASSKATTNTLLSEDSNDSVTMDGQAMA